MEALKRIMGNGSVAAIVLLAHCGSAYASQDQVTQTTAEREELGKLATSYLYGYLAERMTGKTFDRRPVFLYKEQLPVALPGLSVGGFMFAGQEGALFSEQAQQAITDENCLMCEGVPYRTSNGPTFNGKVILAGTTDKTLRKEFKRQYLKDAAVMATESKLSREDAVSVVPVFRAKESGFEKVGELIDIGQTPEAQESSLFVLDVGAVGYYTLEKNRLSRGENVPVGAVVLNGARYDQDGLGITLHFAALHSTLSKASRG